MKEKTMYLVTWSGYGYNIIWKYYSEQKAFEAYKEAEMFGYKNLKLSKVIK